MASERPPLRVEGRRIVVTGPLGSEHEKELGSVLDGLADSLRGGGDVRLDLTECDSVETVAAAVLHRFRSGLESSGTEVRLVGASDDLLSLFESFEAFGEERYRPVRIRFREAVEDIGEAGRNACGVLCGLWSFTGSTMNASLSGLLKPGTVRWGMVRYYMEQSGAKAVPIIAALCFLLGAVLGYMGGYQLKAIAAESFMPDFVAYAMLWEISPMLAAVIVAGRSGSAFAAEIGTMQVRQEIDALKVMGFNVFGFVVTPKMLALMCVMPFLVLLADISGVLGGMLIGSTYLDMPVRVYLSRTAFILYPIDVWWGMLKSIVYAVIVANVGCYMGMKVRGGAAEVGRATTSAVVAGIFLVIVADALIAIAYMHVRPPVVV
ncbi:MAG: ABC transporter permease [Candidatus Fermentibacteraceae bacterium]